MVTGAGVLHNVTVNAPGTTWVITLADATSGATPAIAVISPTAPITLTYDVQFYTGLQFSSSGTAGDITISFDPK